MTTLNDAPVRTDWPRGAITACTDVTGFGLAGHASEMALASDVTLVLDASALPVLPGALRLAEEFLPCGGRANLKHFKGFSSESSAAPELHLICLDPQTSGGLLMAVDPDHADFVIGQLTQHGIAAPVIGRVEPAVGSVPDRPLVRLT